VQKWQRRRRAKAMLDAGDVESAIVVIGKDAALRDELAEGLLDSGRLDLSQALLGHRGGSTFDALLKATPADPELDRLLAEAASRNLPSDARVLELSKLLLERGEQQPALSLLERAALSTRNVALLRPALEACLEAKAWTRAWHLVEAGLGAMKRLRGTPEHQFLLRAHEQVLGQLEGPEAVKVDLLMRGELDPFSNRNHLLLVQALMRGGPPLSTRLTLVSASQELREGEERLRSDRKDATGLMMVGSAKLRLGELDDAIDAFERGRLVAPRHFALVAGLGAAKTFQHEGALEKIRALPDLTPMDGLAAVLPDLDQLTMLELRVVQASAKPIASSLPALASSGKTVRILPLDVRVSDVPAGRCVRVEELFDTSEHGWALKTELAKLASEIAG
jgi:tetratricopeptide (TPR) repeat protein